MSTQMAATAITSHIPLTSGNLAITLSVSKVQRSPPQIHIRTFLDCAVQTNNQYPLAKVYQSFPWPELLRDVPRISVAIMLGDRSEWKERRAMNHVFAGLLNFLDAASEVKFFRVSLPHRQRSTQPELLRVLRPLAIWERHMPDVEIKLVNVTAELQQELVRVKRSQSRSDDSIEQFFRAARLAARAASRLFATAHYAQLASLDDRMSQIMKYVDGIGSGHHGKLETATENVRFKLAEIMDGS